MKRFALQLTENSTSYKILDFTTPCSLYKKEKKKFGGAGFFFYLCSRVNLLEGENDAKSKQIFNKKKQKQKQP